jgi:hypothetical protein
VMNWRRLNLSNCIPSPPARAGLQDIELARISQRVSERPCHVTGVSVPRPCRRSFRIGRTCGRRACELPALPMRALVGDEAGLHGWTGRRVGRGDPAGTVESNSVNGSSTIRCHLRRPRGDHRASLVANSRGSPPEQPGGDQPDARLCPSSRRHHSQAKRERQRRYPPLQGD